MPARFRFCAATALLTLLLGGTAAAALVADPLDGLTEVGSGELRWFGLDVYEARLLTPDGRYASAADARVAALEITYRRHISSERLVRTTEREWRRLGRELGLPAAATVSQWLDAVARIWPDVSPGDRIIARVEPVGPTRFYGNDGLLGVLEDARFGPAFLGIWLHPSTRAAELRAELLGMQP